MKIASFNVNSLRVRLSQVIRWLGENQVPFVICFTKTDKSGTHKLNASIQEYKNTLLESWETLPQFFLTSATNKTGKEEILGFISQINSTAD